MGDSVILITGASGYLGRRVVAKAQAHGRFHGGVHRATPNAASSANQVELDVTDRDGVIA